MMNKFYIKVILCLSLIVVLTACVTHPPKRMDSRFGNAIGMAKAQHTVNPVILTVTDRQESGSQLFPSLSIY